VSTSTSAPLLGATLGGRYEIVRHIARGGMGDVYEARDQLLGRPVAVKVFRATADADRQRFESEIRTLASLNHPGLVQVFDAGQHDGDEFVVLELVDGPTLATAMAAEGSLPPATVAAIGAAMAGALAYVHQQGVVHRDVTPSNILRGSDGRPRLADFGIARLLDTSRITLAASTIGTAAYMAPEQVEGRAVTPAADVYSLGLVLREALTGTKAFEGVGHEAALARLARDPDVTTGVPAAWQELLASMTARDPDARPTASEAAARLAALPADDDHAAAPVAGAAGAAAAGAAADEPTAAAPVAGAIGASGAAAAPLGDAAAPVDPEAVTEVVPAGGGTSVMPAALRPSPEPAAAPAASVPAATRAAGSGSRRALWIALGAILLVLAIGLVAGAGSGGAPTTTTEPVVTAIPTTTTLPPTTTTTELPEERDDDGGRPGKGKKGDRDDDD
jgi:hypothetical protein